MWAPSAPFFRNAADNTIQSSSQGPPPPDSHAYRKLNKKRLIASFLTPGNEEGVPLYGTPVVGRCSGHEILSVFLCRPTEIVIPTVSVRLRRFILILPDKPR